MGWPIVPCEAKAFLPKGWVRMANDAAAIEGWDNPKGGHKAFAGTGVRIEGDMLVFDLDIDTPEVMDAMIRMLKREFPELKGGLMRSSGGVSLAIFMRVSEPVGYRRTAIYGDGEKVEVFGSKVTRYFAIHGPHSKPGREYSWITKPPWECALSSLPVFDAARIGALVDRCDAVFAEHLARVPNTERPEDTASIVYDLEPGKTFITTDGAEVELEALERELAPGDEARGILDRKAWTASKRKNHCKAFLGPNNRLIVFDFQEYVSHRWKGNEPLEPVDIGDEARARLKAVLDNAAESAPDAPKAKAVIGPPRRPPAGCPLADALAWMVEAFAHCRGDVIVPIWDIDVGAAMSVTEFNHRYQKYSEQKAGSKPGVLSYASRVWLGHPDMVEIDGFDMRPDMPFPLFEEDGKRYKNVYAPPAHRGEGEVETFIAFMAHLIPDEAEREHYLDSVAYKVMNPHIPGLATIMVAEGADGGTEQSGTGRGTWFKILERLFGWRYAKRVDWEIVAGTSPQATYTDWQADLVMVFVEESKEVGSSRYTERKSVYEHLKTVVDSAPRRATVRAKYGKARDAMLNATFLFATNHADAMQIPDTDRRFLMISNGEKLGEALARAIHAWMAVEGNIAALERWLRLRDVSAYDPMAAPIMTDARERMVELAASEVDHAVRDVLKYVRGKAFTRSQVRDAAQGLLADIDITRSGNGVAQFNAAFKRVAHPLSMPGIRPKQQWRFRVSAHRGQERGYTLTQGWARHMENGWAHDAVLAEIMKNESDKHFTDRVQAGLAEVKAYSPKPYSGEDEPSKAE